MPVVKKYYHDIDLDNNQLISAVIENRTTAPATAVDGQVYYNTVDKKIYSYNAATSLWQEVGSGTVTSVALSAPTGFSVSGSPVTTNGTLALSFTAGYALPTTASQTNWDTAYTNRITSLTVTGSSGSATLLSNVLNVPTYTLAGLGGQPLATNLTSLSGLTYVSASFVKMTAAGTFTLDTNTYYLASNPSGYTTNTGTVTTVSVVSANGFAGTVATAGTTPAITLTTTITGLLKGNGTSISAAVAGTDYVTSNIYTANGTISASRTVTLGTNLLTFTGSQTGSVSGSTTIANTSSGLALDVYSTSGIGLRAGSIPATASDVSTPAVVAASYVGTPLAGFGTQLQYRLQTSVNGPTSANTISNNLISKWTNATDATRTSEFIIQGVNSAVTADLFTLSGNGRLRLNKYGVNTFTGTIAYYLAVDSSGNIIEASAAGGGTVTSVSVVSANGFAGTVATSSTTPAITLTTTISGVLKGNGTAISAAVANTDFQSPITLTVTGSSGASSFNGTTLNIPTYTLAGLGGFANPMTTLGDIIYGGASGAATRLAGNITTAKQYLSQTGTSTVSAVPAWATIAGSDITGAALTKTDDTNVTLTLGGTPATSLLRAASLTLAWTGQLAVGRGGTGASTLTGVVIGNGASAMTAVSSSTALQVLRVNSGGTGYEFATLSAGGSVTTVSVVSANGFAGTVATASTTPAITLTTTITGLLKGNGTAISAAVAGTDYLTSNQSITLSGDISGTGSTAITTTIGANRVTNAMLAQVATGSFLGRVTAATGNVETLTGTQATTLLDVFTSTLKGLVPLSGGGTTNFLRADGTWAAPAGGSGITTLNTLIDTTQTFATGTSGTNFNISSATGTHTFNIPDAGASARGLVTTGTQTFAGNKSFSDTTTLGGNNSFSSFNTNGSGSVTLTSFSSVGYKNSFTNNSSSVTLGNSSISATVGNVFNAHAGITAPSTGSTYGAVITVAVRSPQVTTSTGTLTNAVGLYISDAPTGATNNYAVWVDDGTVRLDAALELQGIPAATSANMLYYDTTTKRVTYGAAPSGSGSVSTVSVVSANGFAGTVATATTTPAITLTTTVTGLLKGNGTAISAAIGNTDYLTATTPEYSGVLTTGTLTFTPSNHFASLATATNSYNQLITQNSGSNPNSSNDIVVNNNLSTDATYYGDFGINSSNFSGTGSLNLPNAVYLAAHTGDLVLGTFTSNAIHFVINAGNSDAATIKTTGQLQLPGYTSTSSFAGTAAGYLAFDSSGNIITVTAPTGGGGYTVTNQTTTYSATATSGTLIVKCDTTGGAFTVTLPTAVSNTATIIIKKTAGSAALTVDGAGSETIDGGLTAAINKVYESITLISDNANWQIV